MTKYIEINEYTKPYLAQLKNPQTRDLEIIRNLIKDDGWWVAFNRASSSKKQRMLSVLKEMKK